MKANKVVWTCGDVFWYFHQASGIGGKSPVQPFGLPICKNIPSEPLTGNPRSVKLCKRNQPQNQQPVEQRRHTQRGTEAVQTHKRQKCEHTCSCSHNGIELGGKIPIPRSFGHVKPSSSIVNGAGAGGAGVTILGSKYGGGAIISWPGIGVLPPGDNPILRRRFASMIRSVSAYLSSERNRQSMSVRVVRQDARIIVNWQ